MQSYLKRYTLDTIWNCAFGLDIDLQNNPHNDYYAASEQVFADATKLNILAYASSMSLHFILFLYKLNYDF